MRVTHEPISSDIIDMELIELKFIFDRCEHLTTHRHIILITTAVHHDNRDFDILSNYQPKALESVNTQTQLFGSSEGVCCVSLSFSHSCILITAVAWMAPNLP